jgi:hypothetical protein
MLFPRLLHRSAKFWTYNYDPLQFAGNGFIIQNYDNGHLQWLNELPLNDLQSEYFICPFVIIAAKDFDYDHCNTILSKLVAALEFFQDHKSKHIFFQLGGAEHVFPCLRESIVFRENCLKGEQSLPMYYGVQQQQFEADIMTATIWMSFQGTLRTHPIRQKMWKVCEGIDNCVIKNTGPYFFALTESDRISLKREYSRLMADSQFVLCPRGESANSIRFFETISCGRVPVLISDNVKLPLEKRIDYSKFVVRVPESEIDNLEAYVRGFNYNLADASQRAREASKSFTNLRTFLENSLWN